jgi:hypothetical protein
MTIDPGPRRRLFPMPHKGQARGVVSHLPALRRAPRYTPSAPTERPTDARAAMRRWLWGCQQSGRLVRTPVAGDPHPYWPDWIAISQLHEEAVAVIGLGISKHRIVEFINAAMPGIQKRQVSEVRQVGKGTAKFRRIHTMYGVGRFRDTLLTGAP